MHADSSIRQFLNWTRTIRRNYDSVQDQGAIQSLRRFLITLWFFVPLECLLALWFGLYRAPADEPAVQRWASNLLLIHSITAVITLVLALVVVRALNRPQLKTRTAVVLQVLLCSIYLLYGALVSAVDLSIGSGIASFILVSFGIAGLSLMPPKISAPLFGMAFLVFAQLLVRASPSPSILLSMQINSFAASVLALIVSMIIWHQYAKGVLLLRELSRNNEELINTQLELEHLAGHDALTGLPNRRLLHDRLSQALASSARSGRTGALLFIDLDNFKLLNDTRGHDIGDQLLQAVARRLSACVRRGDTVARLGGDEFVVMLVNLSDTQHGAVMQVEIVAEKILGTLNAPYTLGAQEHLSTPSIGITLFDRYAEDAEELMKRADIAMYQAKDAGRNRIRFFDPQMQAQVDIEQALKSDLREGIAQGQFSLHYQPQIDATGRIAGAEALIRWYHPARGMVSPAHFIPLAEESDMILSIGQWVLESACRKLAQWSTNPGLEHISIAVNVSARQFRHADFVEQVLGVIAQTAANPCRLKLELTESLLVQDIEELIEKMQRLKTRGISFSLDDFGTGYSSLSYLKRLPLDQLKIDQSFVRDVLTDSNDAAIAQTIVALANSLGLEVIAEGVETQEQRQFLAASGCLSYQGYLFSKPLPEDAFERFAQQQQPLPIPG